eukprot:TRINITY_DN1749_c0_g1_i3.p1 TRINITY_DN1749_c0_g1~~TRINITY_DN1749_c0_g1_i3.p1  ORF type:complete len:112 (-),score=18.88 TRINITY_DN1749_c0_g1_i3:38-373(-)
MDTLERVISAFNLQTFPEEIIVTKRRIALLMAQMVTEIWRHSPPQCGIIGSVVKPKPELVSLPQTPPGTPPIPSVRPTTPPVQNIPPYHLEQDNGLIGNYVSDDECMMDID